MIFIPKAFAPPGSSQLALNAFPQPIHAYGIQSKINAPHISRALVGLLPQRVRAMSRTYINDATSQLVWSRRRPKNLSHPSSSQPVTSKKFLVPDDPRVCKHASTQDESRNAVVHVGGGECP